MSIRGDKHPNHIHISHDSQKTTQEGSEKSSEKGSEKSSEKNRDRIVREMKENPSVTIHELATMLSISDRAVSKHIKKLQEEGLVVRVGADRGGFWKVISHSS